MSFVPGFFGKFGRPTNDLLNQKFEAGKDDFCHGATVKTQSNEVTIKATSTLKEENKLSANVNITHEGKATYGNSSLQLDTAGKAKLTARFTKLYPGLALANEVEFKTSDPKTSLAGKITAEYSQPNIATSVDYASAKDAATISAVYGQDGICGGVSVVTDVKQLKSGEFNPSKDIKVDFGASYEEGSLNFSAIYDAKQKATLTAFHRVSGDFQMASKYETDAKANTLSVGGQYKINASTLFKAKTSIVSDGSYAFYGYVQHSMANPNVVLGVSASYNHEKQSAVGVKADFGCY